MRMAWTVLVFVVALASAAASSWAFMRFARRFLRTTTIAWTQMPAALWIAACSWTLVLLFGLNLAEWLFPTPYFEQGDAHRIGRLAIGLSFYTLAPLAIPSMISCAFGSATQIAIDRLRAAWRSLVLLAVPPAVAVASWLLFSVCPQAIRFAD